MQTWRRLGSDGLAVSAAIVVAAAALLAAIVWRPTAVDSAAVGAANETEPAAAASLGTSSEAVAVAPEAAAAPARSEATAEVEKVEVCGFGWVDANADGTVDPESLRDTPALGDARRALVESIRESGDELGLAASLVFDMQAAGNREDKPWLLAFCREPRCDISEEGRRSILDRLERLARLAVATSDPCVYALAYRTCTFAPEQGSCALLNVGQWARLDAGNAAPWLRSLSKSAGQSDIAETNEALYRIGVGNRLDERWYAVAGLLADRAGPGDQELAAAGDLVSNALSWLDAGSPRISINNACSVAASADPQRRQLCDAAAAALAERSDAAVSVAVGTAIGRRIGWPDERVDAANAVREALWDASAILPPEASPRSHFTCDELRRGLADVRQMASFGEIGFARRWLAARGKSIEPYIRRAHDSRLRREADERRNEAAGVASASGGSPR